MHRSMFAIDTHTHLNHGSKFDSQPGICHYDASFEYLQALNKVANIEAMFCSTFSSVKTTEEVEEENQYMFELASKTDGLYQWVVVDPRNENTFKQADKMLRTEKCVGVKLHPPNHQYSIDEFGDKLFSFMSEYEAIVQIHPEREADYILDMANKYPKVTFIMAHVGGYHHANAIEFAKNRNVYVDTSGLASSCNKGIEYVVGRVGSDRMLFGTDTYAAGFQRGRIEYALISDADKENILRNNALKLFEKFLTKGK